MSIDSPLRISIDGGVLTLSIGLEVLKNAVHSCPEWPFDQYQVDDLDKFGNSMMAFLKNQQKDGTTIVHYMFDSCAMAALENKFEGFKEVGNEAVRRKL